MIYDQLARYYDALVGDDEACRMWEEFVKKHVKPCKMLELACGSGEITNALYQDGYDILATDISEAMINELNKKYPYIKTQILDMNNFNMIVSSVFVIVSIILWIIIRWLIVFMMF